MNIIDTFNDELAKNISSQIDNAIFNFLNNNGYVIDSITNIKRLKEITQELKEMNLFIDYIQLTLPSKVKNKTQLKVVTTIICPFFNYISNPIDKEEMMKVLEEKYDEGEIR